MTRVLVPSHVPSLAPPTRPYMSPSPEAAPRRPLPVVQLINARQRSTVYGLTIVDGRGRVADRTVTLALGWRPGDRLRLTMTTELITLAADAHGPLAVSGQGRVHVPAAARHACRINPGDRVLLAAEPDAGVLLIHPLTTIDAMLAQFHDRAIAGAAA